VESKIYLKKAQLYRDETKNLRIIFTTIKICSNGYFKIFRYKSEDTSDYAYLDIQLSIMFL